MCSFRVISFFVVLRISITVAQIIELPNGKLQGSIIDNYYSYTNIPYAELPKRFEPSKPLESRWKGIQNGTGEMLRCFQFDGIVRSPDGQEDCLFINVFTPKRPPRSHKFLPVFVYIHGGAFMFGSAALYSPKTLMAEGGMVVVSFNYRLGPLGFLTTEDGVIQGNLGLKDQYLAMKWIKTNIHLFGGDPERILLTGQSAGGASVHLHMLRKETEGLISAAVSISGSALNPWVMQRNAKEKAEALATHLNCPLGGERMKICLQDQPIEKVHAAVMKMFKFLDSPFNLFGPIVEGDDIAEAFITSESRSLIERGHIAKVPWMVTFTTEDGAYNAGSLLKKNDNGVEYIEDLNERWMELAPYFLFYYNESCSECEKKLSASFKEMYMGRERFSVKTYMQMQKMFTDVNFVNGILEAIRLHRMFGSSPVYGYVYGNAHNYGIGNYLSNNTEFEFGATHGDDEVLFLPFTFSTNYTTSTNDLKISKYLIQMFKTFISKGIPQFRDTVLPENRNTLQPMQFLHIFGHKYCVGPWDSFSNQVCQSNECFDY